MEVILTVTKGPARTKSVRLRAAETIIGRSRDCDLCIPSADVSRRHCLLALSGRQLTVEDLTSANGTFLNDQRVTGIQQVSSGDQLRIGPLTFIVDFQATRTALEALDAMSEHAPQGFELVDVVPVADEPSTAHLSKDKADKKGTQKKKPAPGPDLIEDADLAIDVVPVEPDARPRVSKDQGQKKAQKNTSKGAEPVQDSDMHLPHGRDFLDFLGKMDE
jgi:pSer/pThr/pTyr-binding forkhead associated (FHA) protein